MPTKVKTDLIKDLGRLLHLIGLDEDAVHGGEEAGRTPAQLGHPLKVLLLGQVQHQLEHGLDQQQGPVPVRYVGRVQLEEQQLEQGARLHLGLALPVDHEPVQPVQPLQGQIPLKPCKILRFQAYLGVREPEAAALQRSGAARVGFVKKSAGGLENNGVQLVETARVPQQVVQAEGNRTKHGNRLQKHVAAH